MSRFNINQRVKEFEQYVRDQESKETEEIEIYKTIQIKRYETEIRGKKFPALQVKKVKAKAYNLIVNCYYTSEEQREQKIANLKANVDHREEEKKKRAEARKNFKHSLKVGDILSSSWGYDQTNIDYYQVIRVMGKSVAIREIGARSGSKAGYGGDSAFKSAVKDAFLEGERGKEMIKRVLEGNSVKIESFAYASPWDGKEDYYSWGH